MIIMITMTIRKGTQQIVRQNPKELHVQQMFEASICIDPPPPSVYLCMSFNCQRMLDINR